HRKSAKLIVSAERALVACTALSTLACFSLIVLLVRSDFRFEYVASYSNRDLPFLYKVAALWAGNDGSLLFWSWLLLVFAGITVLTNRKKNRELMPYVVATLGAVVLFFTYLNYWVCNPFGQLGVMTAQGPEAWAPADGRGLNPLLQHPIMAIHPPILYIGYVGFVVPFAFCIAALISGRLGAEWITSTRRWTLVAWFFLGMGLLLGGRWAYVELGWGGYWAWDPVENAALLPWLTGTAYLHSVMIQERKGMLKIWNVSLVILTYLLCVFGTFLTRSGVVSSVHAFAESDFAKIFLLFIGIAGLVSAALVVLRLSDLKSENELDSMVSRESGFLYNNLLFLVASFAVLWGTMYPVLSEAIEGEKAMVGPAWFNRVNVPIGLALLALTGIGPLLAWRKSSLDSLRRNFTWPLVAALATAFALVALGMRHVYALMCFALSALVLATIVQEFHKGARVRQAHRGGGYFAALVDLTLINTRRYGGYIVHFGIVLIFIGVAGSAFDTDTKADLAPGESVTIRGYEVTLAGIDEGKTPNYEWLAARLDVRKNERILGTFDPQKHYYIASQQPTSEVRRYATFQEDLYLVFAGMAENKATVQVFVKPLVRWVWLGGIVVFLGTVVTIVPSRRALKLVRKTDAEQKATDDQQRKEKYEVA
ncbi:MAG TPA: heme lyase CcmF/NrfE family subunit, partial [Vicinamibacteria bacterium]|nr:heme lyase CcmF/NrfE family subunit [Vicinamibacteria bacterium]